MKRIVLLLRKLAKLLRLPPTLCCPWCRVRCSRRCSALALLLLAIGPNLTVDAASGPQPVLFDVPEFENRVSALVKNLPALQVHSDDYSKAALFAQERERQNYLDLAREKIHTNWFAALVCMDLTNSLAIERRFITWKCFLDFVEGRQAVVDFWSCAEGGLERARRLSGADLADFRKQPHAQPVITTLTFRVPEIGTVITQRVEFGFHAPGVVVAVQKAYQHQRELQLLSRDILRSRDALSRFSALAQWEALQVAMASGQISLIDMPSAPNNANDLFVAFEYEVDEQGLLNRPVRMWRESEVHRHVVREGSNRYRQVLLLGQVGQNKPREVRAFQNRGVTNDWQEVPAPVPGQDFVELRVSNAAEPNPRRWNALEFGEPDVVQQASLANFGLLSAYLDKKRKELALKKSYFDVFAEAAFAGLNVGGGATGIGFPIGAAARLGYNAVITPALLPKLPSPKQMKDLFLLLAARSRHPEIRVKPLAYLNKSDVKKLEDSAADLSDADVSAFLQEIADEDLKAMLRLAKLKNCDDKVTLLLSLVAEAGRVSGWSEQPGWPRDVFNSIYFSVTGEISLDNILLVLAGARNATPYSGTSLKTLLDGNGPSEAWFQYFDFTVNIRAIVNTVARLRSRDLADKELKKPFPYSPRLSDLSAYEIRIFGFPLLIWHKRGLMKADYSSYTNDYAYGMIGERIVEHFSNKEEMDAEILAGRMTPLGYVRVLDRGHWKESNLAVFAHHIPHGKYASNTTVIIYGLKAYQEQSQLMRRELERFKQYEQSLLHGGVIEQVMDADDRAHLPASTFEPKIHVGSNALDTVFTRLLSPLLEWDRDCRLRAWGVPRSSDDTLAVANLRQQLLSHEVVALEKESPLLGIDRHNSSFIYRKITGGHWQTVKVVSIPSMTDIAGEVAKTEEGARIERVHQAAISSDGDGIVFINVPSRVGDRYEVGPLWQGPDGDVMGYGVRAGTQAVQQALAALEELPIADQALLRFNHYSGALVDLDVDGDGQAERVFMTIEFPPEKETRRESTNRLSGEREVMTFKNGKLIKVVTEHRIKEIEWDESGVERASRIFGNSGTRLQPEEQLLEETRTLETWLRDLSKHPPDPRLPVVVKLRINHLTGEIARETFGLYPSPVSTTDSLYVTTNEFNDFGVLTRAAVRDNTSEFGRFSLQTFQQPLPGIERFILVNTNVPKTLSDLLLTDYKTTIERRDLVRGLTNWFVSDNAHGGRKVREIFADPQAHPLFAVETTYEFNDNFLFGLVPSNSTSRSVSSGKLLSKSQSLSYNTFTRRLVAAEWQHTDRWQTNVFDYRWESPVEIHTAGRRTTNRFNRTETTNAPGTIVSSGSNEELSTFSAVYDMAAESWKLERTNWFRPGVVGKLESETRSSLGRLLSNRTRDPNRSPVDWVFESNVDYDGDGIENTNRIYRWTSDSAPPRPELHQLEHQFIWHQGFRSNLVQTFLDGGVLAHYCVIDDEGRTVQTAIRSYPDLDLRTVITYDGDSDRILESKELANGRVRFTQRPLAAEMQPDGTWLLPVAATPAWGISYTNRFRLGDPFGRVTGTLFENGDIGRVETWFPGTAVARIAILYTRDGRPKERMQRQLFAGTNEAGLHYDWLIRQRISHWDPKAQRPVKAEQRAIVSGTDIPLFKETALERLYYDLSKPYDALHFAIDTNRIQGLTLNIDGVPRPNVTTVFRATTNEFSLALESVDLQSLFYHKYSRKRFDRAGKILEEQLGKVRTLGTNVYSLETLQAAVAKTESDRLLNYKYNNGALVLQTDTRTGVEMLVFTTNASNGQVPQWLVNANGSREWLTSIEERQATCEAMLGAPNPTNYLFRVTDQARELRTNPYQPDLTNVWTAWMSREFGPKGEYLSESEIIYDAQGDRRTSVTHKKTSSGEDANKIGYWLSESDTKDMSGISLKVGTNLLQRETAGAVSNCNFIYFYVHNPQHARLMVEVADSSAIVQRARFVGNDAALSKGILSFWPVASGDPLWSREPLVPANGAVVIGPAQAEGHITILVISVPDLASKGLALDRAVEVNLIADAAVAGRLTCSEAYRLVGTKPSPPPPVRDYSFSDYTHSSSSVTFERRSQTSTQEVTHADGKWKAICKFGSSTFAIVEPQDRYGTRFPVITLLDTSEADAPRPLYALAAATGDFLEFYKTLRWGDVRIYTLVSGSATPEVRIFRAGVLDDELSPGVIAYGHDFGMSLPLIKRNEWWSQPYANVHNRMIGNVFKYAGDHFKSRPQLPAETDYIEKALLQANLQAKEISQLPLLAEAMLPRHPIPWSLSQTNGSTSQGLYDDIPTFRTNLVDQLRVLAGLYPYRQTRLIPTDFATEAEPFVHTVREAALIELAVFLNETNLASRLLAFYSDISQDGKELVASSYDARNGAMLDPPVATRRPNRSVPTAEAQLAITEAAFRLGLATGNSNCIAFGANLTEALLKQFRDPSRRSSQDPPRGLSESRYFGRKVRLGFSLWPEPNHYAVRSNARAYLLLKRVCDNLAYLTNRFAIQRDWVKLVRDSRDEQEKWLRHYVLSQANLTGVVPKGLIELQDINNKSNSYCTDRWTCSDDWLSFLEAAKEMGENETLLRSWLENLARVHGVTVQGEWGLDWCIALRRPDAISVDLTARFLRVAKLLNHTNAQIQALASLRSVAQLSNCPVVITDSKPNTILETGDGHAIYPVVKSSPSWPSSFGVHAEMFQVPWTTNVVDSFFPRAPPRSASDLVWFQWGSLLFYILIFAVSVIWWILAALRKGVLPPPGNGALVSPSVMQLAEERWAKRVLGVDIPANSPHSRFSNGPIEQGFQMQLRAIYKLVLEWRRRDDPNLVKDNSELRDAGGDAWLNGMDEYAVMVGIYSRWVFKAGRKDGRRSKQGKDILKEHEDSNFLWARLSMFFSESHWKVLDLLKQYDEAADNREAIGRINENIERELDNMGVRRRQQPFNASQVFQVRTWPQFSGEEFSHPDKLVQEFRKESPLSCFLWSQFETPDREVLLDNRSDVNEKRRRLAAGLNKILANRNSSDKLRKECLEENSNPTQGTPGLCQGIELSALTKKFILDEESLTNQQLVEFTRVLLNDAYPDAIGRTFDLLILQYPNLTLQEAVERTEHHLQMKRGHFISFVKKYKRFKEQENVDPIHPYALEFAKLFPHFLILGILAVIGYNDEIRDLPVITFLHSRFVPFLLSWSFWIGGGLFLLGWAIRNFTSGLPPKRPRIKTIGWLVGAASMSWFGGTLLYTDTPTFATFVLFKGLLAMLFFAEALAIILPLLMTYFAKLFEDYAVPKPSTRFPREHSLGGSQFLPKIWRHLTGFCGHQWHTISSRLGPQSIVRFINELNFATTRPASVLWLSFKYHFQPSVPSGGFWPMVGSVLHYSLLTSLFLFVGIYISQSVISSWFLPTYQGHDNIKLLLSGIIFWSTMYLLRFGLFVLLVSFFSSLRTFPIKTIVGTLSVVFAVCAALEFGWVADFQSAPPILKSSLPLLAAGLIAFERPVLRLAMTLICFVRSRLGSVFRRKSSFAPAANVKPAKLGVVFVSGDSLSAKGLKPDLLAQRWRELRNSRSAIDLQAELLMDRWKMLREKLDSPGLALLSRIENLPQNDKELEATLLERFRELATAEEKANVTLWHSMQLLSPEEEPGFPNSLRIVPSTRVLEESDALEMAKARSRLVGTWHIRRWLTVMMSTAGQSQDTGINIVDIAVHLREANLESRTVFYLLQNKYDDRDDNRPSEVGYDKGELGQRNKLADLLQWICPDSRVCVINDWTGFGFKAGALMGTDFVHEESLNISNLLMLDRNAAVHDLDSLMKDISAAMTDSGIVNVFSCRGTTNTRTQIGHASQMIEECHRSHLKGLMLLGATAGEAIGTGWGNIQAVYYGRVQRALVDPHTPRMPLTSSQVERAMPGGSKSPWRIATRLWTRIWNSCNGLIGFGPHAIGISEDIWSVTQATHSAIALGETVKFRQSEAFWHKLRETWSHAEWFTAFPRWSGGFLQMMFDPIMQRIADMGPLSVFAKEVRANGGRFFLSTPLALLNLCIMPLAIVLDVSPFIGILVILWHLGFLVNQSFAFHGLLVYLERAGFSKITACIGAFAAWSISTGGGPLLQACTPALMVLGFLVGGYAASLGRWFYDRARDLLLFGPQLVAYAAAQILRQKMEFVTSGADSEDASGVNMNFRTTIGRSENKPNERYRSRINLINVVWGIGLLLFLLNLYAMQKLDFLNALLLLPALLFSVSVLIGPFIMKPETGKSLGRVIWIPRLIGWLCGFAYYFLVVQIIGQNGPLEFLGWTLLGMPFALISCHVLNYVWRFYRYRLDMGISRFVDSFGEYPDARLVAESIINNKTNRDDLRQKLSKLLVTDEQKESTEEILSNWEMLEPLLDLPGRDLQTGWLTNLLADPSRGGTATARFLSFIRSGLILSSNSRFLSSLLRSGVTSLFVLVWFVLVPIPGLMVFEASDHKLFIDLQTVLLGLLVTILCMLVALVLAQLGDSLALRGISGRVKNRFVTRIWESFGKKLLRIRVLRPVDLFFTAGLIQSIERCYKRFQVLQTLPNRLSGEQVASLYALFTDVQTYVDQGSYEYARRSLRLISRKLSMAEEARFTATA